MKRNILEIIEKEIKSHYKISKHKKTQIINEIFKNLLVSSGIILYFILLILAFINIEKQFVIIAYRALSIATLALAIILFEKAYKKDSGNIAMHGIEVLAIAIITLFLPYIFFKSTYSDRIYVIMIGVYISLYYLVKSIFVYKYEKKKFLKNSSDIIEIVKKESKDKIIAEGIPTVENEIEEPIKKKTKKVKTSKKAKTNKNKNKKNLWNIFKIKTNKTSKEKSKNKQEELIIPKEESKQAKRGRPKKETAANIVAETIIEKPKAIKKSKVKTIAKPITTNIEKTKPVVKRGRPKKIVSADTINNKKQTTKTKNKKKKVKK